MNLNVVNRIYGSGLNISYLPVQLPDIPLINNLTIINNSGSVNPGPIYLGGSGVTWETGFTLVTNAGLTIAVDNANIIFAVCQSGYTASLRYLGN